MEINADLTEKALATYKVWLEQPTGPGLTELNEQVKQAGFVRPGGGLDFGSFMAIAVKRGIRKPYQAPVAPPDAPRRGPRGAGTQRSIPEMGGHTAGTFRD